MNVREVISLKTMSKAFERLSRCDGGGDGLERYPGTKNICKPPMALEVEQKASELIIAVCLVLTCLIWP